MVKAGLYKKILPVLIFALISSALAACGADSGDKVSKSDFVLNTVCTITLYDSLDEGIIDECFSLCRNYEAMLSRTDEDSEIYRLNHREISEVSDETAELISIGLEYSKLSGGKFDITIEPLSSLWDFSADSPSVPSPEAISDAVSRVDYTAVSVSGNTVNFANDYVRIDLGAVAKGYIADKLRDYLISRGIGRAIINLGGNVLCIGSKTDGGAFEVGIQRPFGDVSIAGVEVRDLSVVTSGVYERYFEENGKIYHHILDPSTGYPYDNGILSVTIVGPSSCTCDALSTTCFALGMDDGFKLIESMDGYYAIYITDDYALHFSDGAKEALKVSTF